MGHIMNNRLKTLAAEAHVIVYADSPGKGPVDVALNLKALEKFAELIIADCSNAIGKNIVGSVHSAAGPWNSAVAKCQQVLRDHYTGHGGVENE